MGFAEQERFASKEMKNIIEQLTNNKTIINVVRWFDAPEQLEVVEKVNRE